MPQEPKKRHSRARQGKRRASIHLKLPRTVECPNCHAQVLSHAVCSNCGFYKGKEILKQKVKKENQQEK